MPLSFPKLALLLTVALTLMVSADFAQSGGGLAVLSWIKTESPPV